MNKDQKFPVGDYVCPTIAIIRGPQGGYRLAQITPQRYGTCPGDTNLTRGRHHIISWLSEFPCTALDNAMADLTQQVAFDEHTPPWITQLTIIQRVLTSKDVYLPEFEGHF